MGGALLCNTTARTQRGGCCWAGEREGVKWWRETGCVVTAAPRRHRWPPVDSTVRWKHKHNTPPPSSLMLSTSVTAITLCPNKKHFLSTFAWKQGGYYLHDIQIRLPAQEPAGIFSFEATKWGFIYLSIFFKSKK